MRFFLLFILISSSFNSLAQTEPTASLFIDGIVVDIPYLEVQTASGKKAYSVGFKSLASGIDAPFFLQTEKLQQQALKNAAPSVISIKTNLGSMKFQLNAEKAPTTVANFLLYLESGYYAGTIFHRVIDGFMIQGGGFDSDYNFRTPIHDPILNEAYNGLKNLRGSIAMARKSDAHSATSQFYINVADNSSLDFPGSDSWGYTVFGEIIEGIDVLDAIKSIPTAAIGPFSGDVPTTQVIIESVSVVAQ